MNDWERLLASLVQLNFENEVKITELGTATTGLARCNQCRSFIEVPLVEGGGGDLVHCEAHKEDHDRTEKRLRF